MSEEHIMCIWQAIYSTDPSSKSSCRDRIAWRFATCQTEDLNINIPTETNDKPSSIDLTRKDYIQRVRTKLSECSDLYDVTGHAIRLMQKDASQQKKNYIDQHSVKKKSALLICPLLCYCKLNSTEGNDHNCLIGMLQGKLWSNQEFNDNQMVKSYIKLMKAIASKNSQIHSPIAITEALEDLYSWVAQEVVDDSPVLLRVCSTPYLDFRMMQVMNNKCITWMTAMFTIIDNTVNWERDSVLVPAPVEVHQYQPPPRDRSISILSAGIDGIIHELERVTKGTGDIIMFQKFLGHIGIWRSEDEIKAMFSCINFTRNGVVSLRNLVDYFVLRTHCSEKTDDQIQSMPQIKDIIKGLDVFRRVSSTGDIVMESVGENVINILPGEHSSIDLPYFREFPPITPQHVVVKDFKWPFTSKIPGKGIFPVDFNATLPVEIATTEMVQYYGVSIFLSMKEPIVLHHPHTIHDIHYKENYLTDYVLPVEGGAGIEIHEFSHLQCPLDTDSGYFILGKMEGSDLHLTAFKVPTQHTLYIPGGIIHSNDYLRGTWRTMLSVEMEVYQAKLLRRQKENNDEDLIGFCFTFD